MLQSSRYLAVLLGLALATPLLGACAASASFKAGGEEAKAPPPPPPPPPPAAEPVAPAPAPTTATPTPAPTPAVDPNAKAVLKKDSLLLPGQIVFESNSAVLKPESEAALDQLKQYLDENPRVTKLRIEGHTDNVGQPAGERDPLRPTRARHQDCAGRQGHRQRAPARGRLRPDQAHRGQHDRRRQGQESAHRISRRRAGRQEVFGPRSDGWR